VTRTVNVVSSVPTFAASKNIVEHSQAFHKPLFCGCRRRYDVRVDTTFTLCSVRPHDILHLNIPLELCTVLLIVINCREVNKTQGVLREERAKY